MQQISSDTIEKISSLSKLNFDESEKKQIMRDMQKIINFVDKLTELDTKGTVELKYILTEKIIPQEDIINQYACKYDILKNAPSINSNYFKVPKTKI